MFLKSRKQILGVDNIEIDKHANFQLKRRIILGYTKMTHLTKLQNFETGTQIYTFIIF